MRKPGPVQDKQCYFTVKKYTPVSGILTLVYVQIILCVPIMNMVILEDIETGKRKLSKDELYDDLHKKEQWEGIFYKYEKVVIKQEDKKQNPYEWHLKHCEICQWNEQDKNKKVKR